jgi:hypothetical protein
LADPIVGSAPERRAPQDGSAVTSGRFETTRRAKARIVPPVLIYCDTNVLARPFDDQSQATIQAEANAFLEIMSRTRDGELELLCSDILEFEISNILADDKRTKVSSYLSLCSERVKSTRSVLDLGVALLEHAESVEMGACMRQVLEVT